MKRIIAFFVLVLCSQAYAQDKFMEFGDDDYEARKSTWLIELGAKYFQNDLALTPYNGTHHKIKAKEKVNLIGAELAVGGNLHLFAGFSLSIKARGFYLTDVEGEIGKASKDFDMDLVNTKSDSHMQGGEGAVALNYTFLTSLVEIQPFVEYALGVSSGEYKIDYNFKGLAGDGSGAEKYEYKRNEDYLTHRISLGLNIISKYGIYSYFKASLENITLQKMRYNLVCNGSCASDSKEDDDVNETTTHTTYALGFGFLF